MSEPTFRICVVCLGNICRSPMAAAVLRQLIETAGLPGAVVVDSAGTGAWHIGEPADPRGVAALRDRGYDGAGHRAQQFTADQFAGYDLVLAVDQDTAAALQRMAPDDRSRAKIQLLRAYDSTGRRSGDLDVPDPYYGGSDGFVHVLDQLERAAAGLVARLQEGTLGGR